MASSGSNLRSWMALPRLPDLISRGCSSGALRRQRVVKAITGSQTMHHLAEPVGGELANRAKFQKFWRLACLRVLITPNAGNSV